MSTQRDNAMIPVSVMTGFLGAGKTTILNTLLKDDTLADTAVIINEFGDVGLDHLFVEQTTEDGIIELSSGCLCCTVRGDLVDTLENLLRKLDNGRIKALKRIVIETTGLADPAPVLHAIFAHPYLSQRYAIDGVVTLVDAVNGLQTLDQQEEAVKQVAVADRLIISKTDLTDKTIPADLKARLRALNPTALMLESSKDNISASNLLDTGLFNPATKTPDVQRWLNAEAAGDETGHHDHDHHNHHGHGHDHGHGHHDHHHDVNRHGDAIRSFSITTDRAVAERNFVLFLDLLRSAHSEKILRVKGIVKLVEAPDRPVVFHAVQSVFHTPEVLDQWPDEDHSTRMVFITKDLPESFVAELFDAFTDALKSDTPDSKVMADNPLAPPGLRSMHT